MYARNIDYDYSKLNGKIKEKYGSQKEFAKAINLSATSVSLKLGGNKQFTQTDIQKCINALDLSLKDIPAYFFASKVKKILN